jgi:transcriptional regulator with XRE-family HTH domain
MWQNVSYKFLRSLYPSARILRWHHLAELKMNEERRRSQIRILRKRWDYTQEGLAKVLNLKLGATYGKSAMSKWESGKTKPPQAVLEELEDMFGVREGYLLEVYGYLDEALLRKGSSWRQTSWEFQVGALKFPLARLIGGTGKSRYPYPDGIQTVFHNKPFIPPDEILQNYYELLKLRRAEAKGAAFEQRGMVRLDDYAIGLSEPYDEPYPLKLEVSLTDYYTMMVTNRSLNTRLPQSPFTLRDIYAKDPLEFATSELANPLAVNLSLVTTKDWKIYVARRGNKVATNPGGFGPAVSGTGNPLLDLTSPEEPKYNPFLTAQRESFEEVTGPYKPVFSEITFFGLARTLAFYFPFLFGELRLDMSEKEVRSLTPQDNWDAFRLISIPFTIGDVTSFIKRNYRYMVENQDFARGTTLFSLYQSLIYQYPEKWEDICQALDET